MRVALSTLLAILLAAAGCGDDDPADVGVDATMDSSVDADADADAHADDAADTTGPPPLGPRGCFFDRQCESGACFHPLGELGLGSGYCTFECTADSDCDTLDVDGYDAACVPVGEGRSRCIRVCDSGFGCPSDTVCLTSQIVGGGNTADVCLDLSLDTCEADADCAPEAFCRFLAADREKVVRGCFTPLDPSGRAGDGLRAGAACDPRIDVNDHSGIGCTADGDCPDGWSCRELQYTDGVLQCHPPPAEQCFLALGRISENEPSFYCSDRDYCGCQAEGLCSGLCRADSDCGPDMRCSLASIVAMRVSNFLEYDDSFTSAGFCVYAAGSQSPCTREADCADTGVAGARETCKLGTDATGAPSFICVTPATGVALPGDACGDDPSTLEIDERPCVNECVAGTCAAACASDADCTAGTCHDFFIDEVTVGGLCVADGACARDADCSGGEVCRLVRTAEGALARCGPPRGQVPAGETCVWSETVVDIELDGSFRCASLPCETVDTYCPTLCADDADCPSMMQCIAVEETFNGRGTLDRADDATGTYSVCKFRFGSLTPCTRDTDCPELGEDCLVTSAGGGPDGQCIFSPGTAGPGTPSTSCAAVFGPIFDYRTQFTYCPGACVDDIDCGDSGLVCRRFQDDRVDVDWQLCVRPDDPRARPL